MPRDQYMGYILRHQHPTGSPPAGWLGPAATGNYDYWDKYLAVEAIEAGPDAENLVSSVVSLTAAAADHAGAGAGGAGARAACANESCVATSASTSNAKTLLDFIGKGREERASRCDAPASEVAVERIGKNAQRDWPKFQIWREFPW